MVHFFLDSDNFRTAWAVWNVYKATGPEGSRDKKFLARAFQKLLMNFTWWVNRKDPSGKHIFSGGFLGLEYENIKKKFLTFSLVTLESLTEVNHFLEAAI
jgi:hypothetical protein